jgi:uncharacterized protein (DUF427 family)
MKAILYGAVIADSDDTVLVEGNHYFPLASLDRQTISFSNHKSMCAWKGEASYYSLLVKGDMCVDAAWYYANPKAEAAAIRDRVAFGKDVKVVA